MEYNSTHPTNDTDNSKDTYEKQPSIVLETLAKDGLGYGEGSINVTARLEAGDLSQELMGTTEFVLMNDPDAFRTVEELDDGCGDGRCWHKVVRKSPEGNIENLKESRLRAKIFGGGLVVGASMWRAIEGEKPNRTVQGDRKFISDAFRQKDIKYGAHTDNHAEADDCGCGAIDKYPQITKNVVKYRSSITETLHALYGDSYDDNHLAIERVFSSYEKLAVNKDYFANSSGKETMELILDDGAVVKEVYGNHKESIIVLNDIDDTSLDQRHMADAVDAQLNLSDLDIQAFVVDTWRGRMLAKQITELAEANGLVTGDGQEKVANKQLTEQIAFADFMIRTLATSTTLTAGDIPVYGRRPAQKPDYSLAS